SKFKQKFKQQKLPAWQPILTADTVLPAFFLIGLLFIPLGAALLFFSENVQEFQLDYTNCKSVDSSSNGMKCLDVVKDDIYQVCTCQESFKLDRTFEKNVYLYYGLDNFYQNHRRYVKSRDDRQLLGKTLSTVSSDCSPFDKTGGKIYAPCGAIANSMFNDTLKLYRVDGDQKEEISLIKNGIAWPTDRSIKFKNPPGSLDEAGAFNGTIKPLYWRKPVYELDTNPNNTGYKNEDLIVWMRTSAFPTFRKLYRKIDHRVEGFKTGLPADSYMLEVSYNYPVHSFGGRKRMILSTTSFLGGKNNFLGIAYITVGAICLLLGIIFLIIHIKFGKR
ncbi:Cell cycle control protein 50A, partial [Halocaridina rubra]